jgi:hypothetical protein
MAASYHGGSLRPRIVETDLIELADP